jgi:hypothetical protein
MIRHVLVFALAALLLLGGACPASAQQGLLPPPSRGWSGLDLSGTYVNTSNGRTCEVRRRGRDYVFINENGTPARFGFVGPNRLELKRGDWNPDTVATVGRDPSGRLALRFREPGQPAGVWVRAD